MTTKRKTKPKREPTIAQRVAALEEAAVEVWSDIATIKTDIKKPVASRMAESPKPAPTSPDPPPAPEGYEYCEKDKAENGHIDPSTRWGIWINPNGSGEWSLPDWLAGSMMERTQYRWLRKKQPAKPAIPEPAIPLGYEQCRREDADMRGGRPVLLFVVGAWELYYQTSGDFTSDDNVRHLRCILPSAIASHWQPAPGATHEEQRENAWPMGVGPSGLRLYAGFVPGSTACVGRVLMEELSNTFLHLIPLVPRLKSESEA